MKEIKLKLYKKEGEKVSGKNLPIPNPKNILIQNPVGLIIYHKKTFWYYDEDIIGYYKRGNKNSWHVFPLTTQQVCQIISDNKINYWRCRLESAINFGYFFNHYYIDDKKLETIKYNTSLEDDKLNYPDGLQPYDIGKLSIDKFLLKSKTHSIGTFFKALWRDIQIDLILENETNL